jgi:hypothetical protein
MDACGLTVRDEPPWTGDFMKKKSVANKKKRPTTVGSGRLVRLLRSHAKNLMRLKRIFDKSEHHGYSWNIEEAASYLTESAKTMERRAKAEKQPNVES